MATKPTDEKLIDAILKCRTITEVSAELKIPRRSIYNKLKNPEFKEKLNEAKSSMLQQAIAKLNDNSSKCIDILMGIAESPDENAQARISACRSILDNTVRLNEQLNILERIETLEQAQKDTNK